MKKEEEEKKRRQQQAKAYRQRLLLERKKRDIADKQISAMEEKMELIERLRRTQDLQRQAYSSLENALQEPVDLFLKLIQKVKKKKKKERGSRKNKYYARVNNFILNIHHHIYTRNIFFLILYIYNLDG